MSDKTVAKDGTWWSKYQKWVYASIVLAIIGVAIFLIIWFTKSDDDEETTNTSGGVAIPTATATATAAARWGYWE